MLFIPAFTRHNLRSKAGDADADEVEFEGCSQRRQVEHRGPRGRRVAEIPELALMSA